MSEGDTIDVWAYTNLDEIEMFLNGRSLGSKKKSGDKLHLMWRIPYTHGTLKAVGRKVKRETLIKEIKTAGPPAKISLQADRNITDADGKDLSFITVKILDEQDTLVPYADNLIQFEISGEGKIIGVDNGSKTSHEPFKVNYRKAFNGLCLAVVQSTEKSGEMIFKANSDDLKEAVINIESKEKDISSN